MQMKSHSLFWSFLFACSHDNQTTHWDSPRDKRQLELLDTLVKEINDQRKKLRVRCMSACRGRSFVFTNSFSFIVWLVWHCSWHCTLLNCLSCSHCCSLVFSQRKMKSIENELSCLRRTQSWTVGVRNEQKLWSRWVRVTWPKNKLTT